MKDFFILNPVAGSEKSRKNAIPEGITPYLTTGVGDCTRYVMSVCETTPDPRFHISGGDGTLNEAVTGVMRANAGDRAELCVIPSGSGNDFVRSFSGKHGVFPTDVLSVNDRYCVNLMNTGFDCDVVVMTDKTKKLPFVSGSLAYSSAVVATLFRKMGCRISVTYEDENGQEGKSEGVFLLTAIGNGSFYGGGFRANPTAFTDDGIMELLQVRKISRFRFLQMVGDYKKGNHIILEDGVPAVHPKFRDCISLIRAKSLHISGITHICIDGEVLEATEAAVRVIPKALRFVF
ncbi:MAG: hypothetical protein J5938_06275 [Clostridia bacterium]|nr:hypothetical protein [Clostridia bacterium]